MNWNGIVSLFIFCIELILLLNVIYFSRKSKAPNTGAYIIALLAGYQLLEFLMCGLNLQYPVFPFLAFADISFLPVLGLIFVLELLNKKVLPKILFFIPAILFIIYYLFVIERFAVVSCTVLYASFNYPHGTLYGAYYYLPIVIQIILLISGLKNYPAGRKKDIQILLAGNLIVAAPVAAAFLMHSTGNYFLLSIIESVMCKFALVLAFCYAYVTLNNSRERSVERNNTEHIPGY